MWFDDEEVSGRRLSAGRHVRRGPVLSVTAGVDVHSKVSAQRLAVFVLVPVVFAALGFGLFLGARAIVRRLFSENPAFAITRIEVKAGTDATRRLAREYTRLSEGMNLFAFNLRETRASILDRASQFKAMEITRQLPGTVRISVTERQPLARLGQQGNLVADHEGAVFPAYASAASLPVILGYAGMQLRPGDRLTGMALAALQALDACDDPRFGLSVDAVRVDREEHLVLVLITPAGRKEAALTWAGMGQPQTTESHDNLVRQLMNLRQALGHEAGRQLTRFDATFEDRVYAR